MKKIFIYISSLLTYPLLATPAFAQVAAKDVNPCTNISGISAALCNLSINPATTFRNIVVLLVVIAVLVAIAYLLYGGIKWITSRGEKTEVEAARNQIMAAIAGLIVVFLAIFIVAIVLGLFGLSLDKLQLPLITSQ